MKKILKVLGVLILLIILALIAVPYFFKDEIAQAIKDAANDSLNAKLEFTDLSLSFISNFPNASVEIDGLSLEGVDQFEGVKLVDVGIIQATVDLASLFGDSYSIKRVALVDPVVDVRVLADGTANYDIAKPSTEPTAEEESSSEESHGGFTLDLQEYSISGGQVRYDDATMPFRIDIEGLNHNGSGDMTASQTSLQTKTTAESINMDYDGVRYANHVTADMDVNLDMDFDQSKYTLTNNVIRLNELELQADGWIQLTEAILMDMEFAALETEFRQILSMVPAEFASDLSGVDVTGTMALDGFAKGTYDETNMPAFGANLKVDKGRFSYPDLPKSVENIYIDVHVQSAGGADLDNTVVDMPRFYAEIADNPIDMSLKLKTPISDPEINFRAQAKIIFEQLVDVIPLEEGDELTGSLNADIALAGKLSTIEAERYDEFNAGGQMILQQVNFVSDSLLYDMMVDVAYFNFSPQFIDISQFKASVGETDMSASGKINNYLAYFLRDEPLQGTFNFQSGVMNLNEFMSDEDADETNSSDEEVSEEASELTVIELPGNIDFELTTTIERMIYDDIIMDNIAGAVALKDHRATLKNFKMEILEGTVLAGGYYEAKPDVDPTIDFQFNIKNMSIKESSEKFNTIDKLAPIAKSCAGNFSTNIKIAATLDEKMEPRDETIDGGGKLQTNAVYIEKFEPLNKLADELGIERLAKQNIEDVDLSYKIKDGKAIVYPFTVKLEGVPTEISGSTALLTQEIDYLAKMDMPFDKLPGNLAGQAGGLMDKLNNQLGTNLSAGDRIPINIHFTGTVEKPALGTNYGDVAKDAANDVMEEVIETVKEEVQEQIDTAKEDAKAKAQEEADKIMADAQAEADKLLADAKNLADQAKDAAYKEAKKVEDSTKNPLEKAATKLAADKLRKEADKAHDKAMDTAQNQADKILAEAKKKADEKINSVE